MFHKLPLPYKAVFVLSVVAAALSVPTMGLVLFDLAEQADWRAEDRAWGEEMARRHKEVMGALCRIESLNLGQPNGPCSRWNNAPQIES